MRLAAVYLDDHYLFDKPQTINLGGKYDYQFQGDKVTRTLNNRFIPNFYSEHTVESVSAIVGKNGSGKTTLIKLLIDNLKPRRIGHVTYPMIFEDGDQTYLSHNLEANFDCEVQLPKTRTIYYSPFLDYNNSVAGIDLSLDTLIDKDLFNIDALSHANDQVVPLRRLKTKNSLRQLEFQHSPFGKELKEYFDFPEFNKSKFSFTRHKIDVDHDTGRINFWNTPREFQGSLQQIYDKIETEGRTINENRPEGYSLVELQKNLLKNYILTDILCLFIKQMEKSNDFLDEGRLTNDYIQFEKSLEGKSAFDSLFEFLDSHSFGIRKSKESIQLLPVDETKSLINRLYELIDKTEAKNARDKRFFDWDEKTIYLDKESTENLIELNNKFLSELDSYYGSFKSDNGELVFTRAIRIDGILNFEPSERSLSSGENALLNLYSRIHDYFKKNLVELKTEESSPFYHIFLDEGDLGFHPSWKKQFVKSTISFLSNYFKSLNSKIQLVFTTHDPLTLSDILNYNIIYLDEVDNKKIIVDDENRPSKSFGANVTDLLADSFFVGNGLIGDFSKEKINECIEWLGDKEKTEKSDYFERLIRNIDEPIIQRKLSEMYDEKMKKEITKDLISSQIEYLQNQLKKYEE